MANPVASGAKGDPESRILVPDLGARFLRRSGGESKMG
jgi:hypothetical protein